MADFSGIHSRNGAMRVTPSEDLLTDKGSGPNRRLRVDVGQTGFFAGREFRTFVDLSLAIGASLVIKAVVPVNIILFGLNVTVLTGQIRVETSTGGTEGGVFSTALPIFPRNTMTERPTPYYTPLVALTSGGTITGGTLLDVTAGLTDKAVAVGAEPGDERGIGPGTYYIKLTAVGVPLVGIVKARWEERVP